MFYVLKDLWKKGKKHLLIPIIISNKIKYNEEYGCSGVKEPNFFQKMDDSFDNFIEEIKELFDPGSRNSGGTPASLFM